MIKLIPVYRVKQHEQLLYDLLLERDIGIESISHQSIPTPQEHANFVRSRPYFAWYFVENEEGVAVGSIYLTKDREVGISVFKNQRRNGYAREALYALIAKWPGKFLANINPHNAKSIALFEGLGFRHIQNTYLLK